MKKVSGIIIIVMALLLTACAADEKTTDINNLPVLTPDTVSEPTPEPAAATPEAGAAISVNEIYARIRSGVQFPSDMIAMDDDYIVNQFGFDLSGFEEYIYMASDNALLAENIIIIKVRNAADAAGVKDKLSEYVSEEITVLNGYLPEQGKVAEASVVDVSGNYVYMLMSSKVSEIRSIVTEALR